MKNVLLAIVFLVLPVFLLGECVQEQDDKLKTTVEYDGTLTCNYTKKFCALIYYLELNSFSSNKDMMFVRLKCTKNGSLHHHTYVTFRGGDGPNDDYYDPAIEIFHNCNKNPSVLQSFFYLDYIDIRLNNDKRKYTFELNLAEELAPLEPTHMLRFKNDIGENVALANEFLAESLNYDAHPSLFDEYNDDVEEC